MYWSKKANISLITGQCLEYYVQFSDTSTRLAAEGESKGGPKSHEPLQQFAQRGCDVSFGRFRTWLHEAPSNLLYV